MKKNPMNYTLLCDFYELTMANGYFQTGMSSQICYFDVFFRTVPDGGGFAIAAGLEQVIEYIENLRFDEEDIAFLRSKNTFPRGLSVLPEGLPFTGDIGAVPEGTPIFPGEPFMTVRAPAIEAQFIETYLLLTLNHQSLIATKANRIVRAAGGRPVSEFGSRRAQGSDGAVLGARAAYIAGCAGTACTLADQMYALPPAAPWPTPGSRCSPTSTPPSRPTASSIPTRPPCWWTPTTCSSRVCPTPSGPSRRCCCPRALPSAPSGWTAAI